MYAAVPGITPNWDPARVRVGHGLMREAATDDYWQAGKSMAGIDTIEPAGEVVRRFTDVMRTAH